VEEQLVSLEIWLGDQLVVFKDVPAGICNSCGEEYFGADIQDKMFSLAKGKPRKVIQVPVFHFSDPQTVARAEAGRRAKERSVDALEGEEHLATDDEIADLLQGGFEEWDEH
jgi:YgiT-type zinc finger domain-containing protein